MGAKKADWQLLADAVPEAVLRLDREGRIRCVNPAAAGLADGDPAGWIGCTPRQAGMPAPLCAFLDRHLPAAIGDGRRRRGRIPGAVPDVLLIPLPDGASALAVLHGSPSDAPMSADGRCRALLDSLPLPIFAHRLGRFVYLNMAAVHLHGARHPDDLLGRPLLDFGHADPRPMMESCPQPLGPDGSEPPHTPLRLVRLDGGAIDVEVTALPIAFEGRDVHLTLCRDVTSPRQMAEVLKDRERALEEKTRSLAAANQALRALLEHREAERRSVEETLLANVRQAIFPHLERMAQAKTRQEWHIFLEILETSMTALLRPLSHGIRNVYRNLTPAEIQVADLIRSGKSSKQIAGLLKVSPSTIAFHRYRLREKLALQGTGTNLAAFLRTLSE
jgi:PAS domain S-box-containing protein